MKKRLWGLAILVLLACGVYGYKSRVVDGPLPGVSVHAEKAVAPGNTRTITVTEDQIYQGNLLLVNKDYPAPPDSGNTDAVNLFRHRELVRGFGLLDDTIMLSPDMARRFSVMIAAAEQEGVDRFILSSGYRDGETQEQLYRQMGADYAMPAGYSEHNLGLSIDIGSAQGEMSQAPEGKWLKENAWRYGFILRYPKDKTDITGIRYEPWHFRFVGLPHSAIMQARHMVLEQYLDDLKARKTVAATIEGLTYHIAYYPVSGVATITVPAGEQYEISGNNVDGVIVTWQD